MPVMDGLTLLSRIKKNESLRKVVVISAYSDLMNIITALNLGASDFVTKPIDFGDLEITMNKAVDKIERSDQTIELKNKYESSRIEKEQLIGYAQYIHGAACNRYIKRTSTAVIVPVCKSIGYGCSSNRKIIARIMRACGIYHDTVICSSWCSPSYRRITNSS